MLLSDMQHSKPHMNFYIEVVFLILVHIILCNVESLMMILLSASLAKFILPTSSGIYMLLCNSCTET